MVRSALRTVNDRSETSIVTGAGSGMGQLAALRLHQQGFRVVGVDVNKVGLDETQEQAGAEGFHPAPTDVTDLRAVEALFDRFDTSAAPVTRVVNAAGIARVGNVLDLDPTVIHQLMSVNYGGTVNVSITAMKRFVPRGGGELVNFASLAGWVPAKRMTAYNATKFAVVGFTEGLWLETRASGATTVCVCPPSVKTAMLTDFFDDKKAKRSMAITPEKVIDSIDDALARGRFLVFPDVSSKALYRLRRHFPNATRYVTNLPVFDLVRSTTR